MLAKGLEVQLSAMTAVMPAGAERVTRNQDAARLYTGVRTRMKQAYGKVWDTIEASKAHSTAEVWSWQWEESAEMTGEDGTGKFAYVPLSHVATPDGSGQTESNAIQLWSLAMLAVERRRELEA